MTPVNPAELYHFIGTYRDGDGNPQPLTPYHTTNNYYFSSIMSDGSSASHHHQSVPRSMWSGDTSQTPRSDIFDGGDMSHSSTVMTIPSTNGGERDFHHLPLPVPDASAPMLPCEFVQYGHCSATFRTDDEEGWIAHIADMHLNHVFPTYCICWFCPSRYTANSNSYNDRRDCYQRRMHHIGRHLRRREYEADDIRPDHYFIDHIHRIRIIGDDEYNYMRQYREGELQQGHNFYPAGWRPDIEEPAIVEVARSSRGPRRQSRTQRTHT